MQPATPPREARRELPGGVLTLRRNGVNVNPEAILHTEPILYLVVNSSMREAASLAASVFG